MTITDIFERGLERQICTSPTAVGDAPREAA